MNGVARSPWRASPAISPAHDALLARPDVHHLQQNDSGEPVEAVPRDHLIVHQGCVPGGGLVGTVHGLPG